MGALFWEESYFRKIVSIKVRPAKLSFKNHAALKYFTKYFYNYTFAQGVPKNVNIKCLKVCCCYHIT